MGRSDPERTPVGTWRHETPQDTIGWVYLGWPPQRINSMAPTFHDGRVSIRKGVKKIKFDHPQVSLFRRPSIAHWLESVGIERKSKTETALLHVNPSLKHIESSKGIRTYHRILDPTSNPWKKSPS